MKERIDDFKERSKHLQNMTDEQLEKYFWELVEKTVNPMVELAEKHTTKSIERSVLLRMGFNSLQAAALVDKIFEKNLLSKGAGHVIWKVAKNNNLDVIEAGKQMIEGKYWEEAVELFKGGEK
ncbi:ornithine aminomutase [Tepiditoga spiralis]|uniref:Ornithine aminomutase n=1 Tax=Tepiditoga spiralis TaxID=2108365 RepID=A0A7G1G894_9BACT|nr:ornithine aminomutase subunit alpha [Tepiditoga spiralis]BBE30252.1 ornithine aminomutase [Tepiditoga spiralis]